MVESRIKPVGPPWSLSIPCAGPGLQAPEGEPRRCVEGFVVEVPWRDLAAPDVLPGRLFRAVGWIVSIITPADGAPQSMALLCPACAVKVHPPEVLERVRKELEAR